MRRFALPVLLTAWLYTLLMVLFANKGWFALGEIQATLARQEVLNAELVDSVVWHEHAIDSYKHNLQTLEGDLRYTFNWIGEREVLLILPEEETPQP